VLLLNDGTLPLNLQTTQRLAVVGELARTTPIPRSRQLCGQPDASGQRAGGPDWTS
jgi:hypothetical protein